MIPVLTAALPGLFQLGKDLLDRVLPPQLDPKEKAAAYERLEQMRQTGELAELEAAKALALGQQAINLEEAKSGSILVAGWRPAIGWVCAGALAIYYIPRFLLGMSMWVKLAWLTSSGCTAESLSLCVLPPLPEMGVADILGLVATMLGSALIRSREKMAGVARDAIRLGSE